MIGSRLLTIVGLVALFYGLIVGMVALFTPGPEIEIRLYEFDEQGQPMLFDPSLEKYLTDDELAQGFVVFPLNLAIRNVGGEPITSATVELSYPRDMDVTADGAKKLDPDSPVLIFEKPLGVLRVESSYSLLEPTDSLKVRVYPIPVDVVVLSSEDFPMYIITVVTIFRTTADGFPLRQSLDDLAEFEVTIIDQNGERYSGLVQLSFPFDVVVVPQYQGTPGIEVALDAESISLVGEAAAASRPRIEHSTEVDSQVILYWESQTTHGDLVQHVWVDDVLRRAMVDLRNDGELDYELWDLTGDGEFDRKIIFDPGEPTQLWPSDAFVP